MLLLVFLKKYWSYVLNFILIIGIVLTYQIYSSKLQNQSLEYIEQAQISQKEYSSKLLSVIENSKKNNEIFITEMLKANKITQEKIDASLIEYNNRIDELNIQEKKELERILQEKLKRKQNIVYNVTKDPDNSVKEMAEKYGFEVYR